MKYQGSIVLVPSLMMKNDFAMHWKLSYNQTDADIFNMVTEVKAHARIKRFPV